MTTSTSSVGSSTFTPTGTLATQAAAAAAASASTSASTSTTDPATEQQNFLTLLVAQLNNQDPMNPLDNAEMTTQIAQLNTVTGINTLNTTVNSLATQMAAMQGIQASALVGQSVLTPGNTLSIDSTTNTGSGSFSLAGAATNVSVEVDSAGGSKVGTVPLGAMAAGQQSFTWDSTGYAATDGLTFKVTATNGSTAVTATAFAKNQVTSVGSDSTGALTVNLDNGSSAAYSTVKTIY